LILGSAAAYHELNNDNIDLATPHPHQIRGGHCPHQPGSLASKVKDNLNHTRLAGIWKVAYDEKILNHNFTCMGTKMIPFADFEVDDGPDTKTIEQGKMLELMTSHGLTDSFRSWLNNEENDALGDEQYVVRVGRQLNFRHPSDRSVAYLEPHGVHTPHIHNLTELHHMNELSHDHFDLQFLRYAQVLDTDYDNFVVLYSCQEAADFALKE
jgi:hypothetical protein